LGLHWTGPVSGHDFSVPTITAGTMGFSPCWTSFSLSRPEGKGKLKLLSSY
jgi:hypothetical protein